MADFKFHVPSGKGALLGTIEAKQHEINALQNELTRSKSRETSNNYSSGPAQANVGIISHVLKIELIKNIILYQILKDKKEIKDVPFYVKKFFENRANLDEIEQQVLEKFRDFAFVKDFYSPEQKINIQNRNQRGALRKLTLENASFVKTFKYIKEKWEPIIKRENPTEKSIWKIDEMFTDEIMAYPDPQDTIEKWVNYHIRSYVEDANKNRHDGVTSVLSNLPNLADDFKLVEEEVNKTIAKPKKAKA